MKLFDNNELKLAILYCLERPGTKNLWREVKKITKRPSFFKFIYFISQIQKSGLYPEMKVQIKIKRSKSFYIMLFKHLIKYDYKFGNTFPNQSIGNSLLPITNEKVSHVIKRWKISNKLIQQFKEKYNLNKEIKPLKIKKISNDSFENELLKYSIVFIIVTYLHIIFLFILSF
jgi:hypothetical protein